MNAVVQYVRQLVAGSNAGDAADRHLLDCFSTRQDEAAFAALVRRHGPMVLGVCRRVLQNEADAEDAFQATFLVLVRKARAIARPELLGNWLYGVAYRTAAKAKVQAAKRRAHERRTAAMPTVDPAKEVLWRDLQPVLDEEVARLPEKYRMPFVLCYLQGKTNDEAARILGCPVGTVFSRLAWARERLRSRLVRRGLTLSGGILVTLLAGHRAAAAVPILLLNSTTRAAIVVAAGHATAGVISPHVASITRGVLRTMFLDKMKTMAVLLLTVAAMGVGAGAAVQHLRAAKTEGATAADTETVPRARGRVGTPRAEADADRPDADPDVAWGKAVKGLRAGLSHRGEKRSYQFGERVGFLFTIKNVSDKPIPFTYFRPTFVDGGSPTVTDPAGKAARVDTPASDIPVQPVHTTLPPGKTLELGEPHFVIRHANWQGKLEETTLYATLFKRKGGGDFQVRYTYRLEGLSPADWSGELTTGTLKLTIVYGEERPHEGAAVRWREQRHWQANNRGTNALAFTPDGKTLATGGDDGVVRLWDVTTAKEVAALTDKRGLGWVRALAFSPDGRTLASGSILTPRTTLWGVGTRKERRTIDTEAAALAFSPDGKLLATAHGTAIRLWDAATGKEFTVLRGHTCRVHALAFAPDGKSLASGAGNEFPSSGKINGEIKLWDVAGRISRMILASQDINGGVNGLAISPDGKTVASAGGGRAAVKLWDLFTGKELGALKFAKTSLSPCYAVAFSPDGKTLAAGWRPTFADRGQEPPAAVQLWDVNTRGELALLKMPTEAVSSVAFSPSGKTLAAAGSEGGLRPTGTVAVWQAEEEPAPAKGAAAAAKETATALVGRMTDPKVTWEKRCMAEDRLAQLPPREILPVLLPQLAKGMPRGPIWNSGDRKLDKRAPVEWQIFYAVSRSWAKQVDKFPSDQGGDLLDELLKKAPSSYAKACVVNNLARHWTADAEPTVARLLKDTEEKTDVRMAAAMALVLKGKENYQDLLLRYAGQGRLEDRIAWYNLLVDPRYQNRRGTEPRIVRLGFELIAAERRRSPSSVHGAYFLAIRVGDYVGQKFQPDQTDRRYRDEHGLKNSFFQDTVNNALAWWEGNKARYLPSHGPERQK